MMNRLLPVILAAALLGPGAAAAAAGAQTCGLVGAERLVLAQVDPVRSTFADTRPASAEPVGSSAEVEAYIRFHHEAAAADARSRLMPWPELRALAP